MTFFGSGGRGRGGGKPPRGPGDETGAFGRNDRMAAKLAGLGVNATKREARVFAVVKDRGDKGTIGSDVKRAIGMELQTVTPAWSPLCEKGYIKGRRDSDGVELMRVGECGAPQTVWYPREPGDPIYKKKKYPLDGIKRLLPKLNENEIEELYDLVRAIRGEE
jgi:hypothetical protein